jgi:subtilisin family serine protease
LTLVSTQFAPDNGILSAWLQGISGRNSGTSMASPHVAGAAALVRSIHPDFNPQQVSDYLVNNATPDLVGDAGTGSPNKLLYIGDIR